jgi:formylglycine-generating enzyme required for sulfatase activity
MTERIHPYLDLVAWHEDNSASTLHDVAQRRSNAWGFHDMLGNVFEWCADAYQPYAGLSVGDPFVQDDERRVLRGGSFRSKPSSVRAAARWGVRVHISTDDVGFRCAMEVDAEFGSS